ncbi:signal recognition particle 19 kDa protein, putative [Entamoeba invadens IP1]|uniref:signal recognition particle 19 kDa protein, putative n=1 Tax=Entamoeba invadens IP1 TaxID=370355 RepID=UPI0002C3EFBE|nr:signal recognition particle 19 kDa protein, putative [Entamoeba invadens IP1]ELP93253.1 signal recognition particle 19 kDa protein, putative [Entamoeba invadens IP1]|eukprot:XP_004260024.1 signal recognition particle 19 kDa protein, putative [Entamoeba invadens IP1]
MSAKPETKRWVVIYPAYMDSELKTSQGRKISKEDSIKSPSIFDLKKGCELLNLHFALERQKYPRQQWVMGRVRVELKDESNQPTSSYKNKLAVIRAISKQIKVCREEAEKEAAKEAGKKKNKK